ncbi:MAG: SlyX family protein [Candidatus Thiodiazotropha sp. (ex Lucinoma aequizonata)]|nr:SlyX family protein [Candidatus Thiodiazotropha sp. (ex Lucinoma aequizonata)]MCU7887495.1 SlyX family protein [Candidatus Thiodiazotropha sp. (ex Lucinoma aequizonata)]MCU7894299.1 SlyX family protein [Candidatus Thiodiazotropha sp. (ex Lucinoma aequizonata)]MCU7899536.1 SlyX family protein [Candidatus Thiodiazotropha sp. (ex Lucinoma aequizonata)]MCU7901283.1 SlyX family protein [Candidatus Thiodiazotropha sp. (ex Lucinoma aequizonata)]
MNERIFDLESRLAFQEEAMNTLSETIVEQQQLINSLARTVEALREHIKAFDPSALQSGEPEPPPPHY